MGYESSFMAAGRGLTLKMKRIDMAIGKRRRPWQPTTLVRWLLRITRSNNRSSVLNPNEFQRALHREWSRSQRIDLPVALVTIEAPPWESDDSGGMKLDAILAGYIKELTERLRCTDIVGWCGERKLGVIFPHTSSAVAWRIMQEVHARIERTFDAALPESIDLKVYASNESESQLVTKGG